MTGDNCFSSEPRRSAHQIHAAAYSLKHEHESQWTVYMPCIKRLQDDQMEGGTHWKWFVPIKHVPRPAHSVGKMSIDSVERLDR